MRRRRRDATGPLYTRRFGPPPLSAMLIFWISLFPVAQLVEIQIYGISPSTSSSNFPVQSLQFTPRKNISNDAEPLSSYEIIRRLEAAATLRVNMLTSIWRILLLHLDDESRVAFERIYEGLRTRYIPAYDYLPLVPIIEGKISRQQLYSVLRLMERISTSYISSYAMLCLESLSDGRVNMELTTPTDLLHGIDNDTRISLAIDKQRTIEVPLTFDEATSMIMNDIRKGQIQPDLECVAALMVNLKNFDATNPEIPDAMIYVAEYMKNNSKPNDPLLEYLTRDHLSGADQLVLEVLERIEASDWASFLLRESVGLLLQNFYAITDNVEFRKWNINELFDVVDEDYYPRSIVTIARYFQKNFDEITEGYFNPGNDLSLYTNELQALDDVVIRISKNPSVHQTVKDSAMALHSFLAQKQREQDCENSFDEVVGIHRALEYLDAFRNPCLPEKLRIAGETLRPYLNDSIPWNYAFGDTFSGGNPYELMVNALINLKKIKISKKLARIFDNFIYQAQYNGVVASGQQSILYDHGIIFQREDSDIVELDMYSLLARIPNVFQDKRFLPLLTFSAKPNLIDYLGHQFNMFEHTKPRSLLIALLTTAIDKPAVRTDEKLYNALRVTKTILEEPTIVNTYSAEELQNILGVLPAIDIDPRYIPIKILFKKENLFKHISPTFSLAGLETPIQHIALILRTIILKPIDKRLEDSIIFALTNLEGPQLPARSYTREDFLYLVSHLFRDQKNIEMTILKTPIYNSVSDWNIVVSGTPEALLARTLSYPVKSLSKNPKLSDVVEKAKRILEEEIPKEVELMKKKTLDGILEYLPDTADLRPVNLLIKKANLAMFLPNINVSSLDNQQPREALIILLENLISSPHVCKQVLLSKRLRIALRSVKESKKPPQHNISSVYTEELLNPLAMKYEPLWKKFMEFNGNVTIGKSKLTLKQFLIRLQEDTKNVELSKAAGLALQEIYYGIDSGMIPAIKDTEIVETLNLLPDEPQLNPLKKLLTPSWVLDVLPQDFQSLEYPKKEQILRIILFMTKQRPEISENPVLMSAISVAEKSLINWKHDVEPLKKIVISLKNSLYNPVKKLLSPKNLNKLQLDFVFDSRQTPRQLLVGLLHNLMLHPKIIAVPNIMRVLDGVRQDILNFGLDSDLLWVLDDAGIPYDSNLAPLRLFLHTDAATARFGFYVYQVNDDVERYNVLIDLLSKDKIVNANQELLNSVLELESIEPNFGRPLEINETDILDIFNAIPDEIIAKYPNVQNLFKDPDTFKNLEPYSEVICSSQPLTMLLLKLGQLPKTVKNKHLGAQVSGLYEALNDIRYKPVISGYDLRPLLRELQHVRQINIDFMLRVIDPNMLSILLPEDFDYDNLQNDTILLNNILEEILAQNVVENNIEFQTHVSSLLRDLKIILNPKTNEKNLPSDEEIKEMLKLIPNSGEFETIRYWIETKYGFDQIPQSFDWSKYPTPLKKLKKILDFFKRKSENDYQLHESIVALNAYLLHKYFFISENDVRTLQSVLNGLTIDDNLIPLRLFFTVENLVNYLPSNFSIERFESPNEAMISILHILHDNERLKTNTVLQNSIVAAIKAMEKNDQLKNNQLDVQGNVETPSKLNILDLRFILLLDIKNPVLKKYLDPTNLYEVLPKSFSFISKPTFKTKALHLLKYLIDHKLGPIKELGELVEEVEILNDLPDIEKEDLDRLVSAINESATGMSSCFIKKYLTVKKLVKILPGNFCIRNVTNVKETLTKLIRATSYGLGWTDEKIILIFEKLLQALKNPSSSIVKNESEILMAELKSLIHEIPFEKDKKLYSLKHKLKENIVLNMLPLNFNLTSLKTRKLKLLKILKIVREHPDSIEFRESLKHAEKYIEQMQNVPKLNDRDINEIFKYSDLNRQDLDTLLKNCKAADLAEYLPIAFDIKNIKNYRDRFKAVIKNCKKLKLENIIGMKLALKNAEIFLTKLPPVDVTRDELNQFFEEICCCNFTSVKPLILFAASNDLLSLLPPKLNLNSEPTVKQKIIALLNALRNIQQFRNEKMYHALDTAKEAVNGLRNKPVISQSHIDGLKKLPIMMAQQVRSFAKIFLLNNLIKVIPPSFDVKDFDGEHTRLALLLKYSENMYLVKAREGYATSLNFARKILQRKAEEEILDYLKKLINNVDDHIPLMLYVKNKEHEFFNGVNIKHGYEYPKIEDRLRVVLKFILGNHQALRSKSLVESIKSLVSKLSVGQPTDYEIFEAVNEIPNSDKNQELKIYLRCKDVQKKAKGLNLTSEHTTKRLLLDFLTVVKGTTQNEEMVAAMNEIIPDVQKAVRDMEFDELFKQIPNFKLHLGKLAKIRTYYVLHGPEFIFGSDYREILSSKMERLKMLVKVLLASPDVEKKEDLKTEIEYLKEILTNHSNISSSQQQQQQQWKTIRDIDMKSLFSVLPKIRSEKIILGLLKFFSDPKLTDAISESIDPSQYKSQGPLMQKIINYGLTLDKVKNDTEQLKALEYVKDKILMTGPGALPIKLNTFSKHSAAKTDVTGIFKSVNIRSANLSNLMPIVKFFDIKYDPLIHGRGFDHEAYTTRGTYLKALLEHLIANPDVDEDIKKHAKEVIRHVRLDGPGAAPVDVNDETVLPENRSFFDVGSNPTEYSHLPQEQIAADIYSHFLNNRYHSPWDRIANANRVFRVKPSSISFSKVINNDEDIPPIIEKEHSALKSSVDRILGRDLDLEKTESAEEEEEDENNWPPELIEKRNSLQDKIKKALGFVKVILPQVNEVESKNRIKEGISSKRDVNKNTTVPLQFKSPVDESAFNAESATFSPDKVLIDIKTRMTEPPFNRTAQKESIYITEEAENFSKKKRRPVKPLAIDPHQLPKSDFEYDMIPHNLSKSLDEVDLVSRKLFIRNDTNSHLGKEDLQHENKTFKKDLSKFMNGEYTTPINDDQKIDVTDLTAVPQAFTLQHSELLQTTTVAENFTDKKNDSKSINEKPYFENKMATLKMNNKSPDLRDDMTVEEFTKFESQNGLSQIKFKPKSVNQIEKIPERNDSLSKNMTNRDNDQHVQPTTLNEHSKKKIVDYNISSINATTVINERKLFDDEVKNFSDTTKTSPHIKSEHKNEFDTVHYRVSLNDDYLDVPTASEIGNKLDGTDNGYFHQIYPKVEKMYDESLRRKRAADVEFPTLDKFEGDVNYDTTNHGRKKLYNIVHTGNNYVAERKK